VEAASGVEVAARVVVDDEFGSVDADGLSDAIEPVEVALAVTSKNSEELAPVEACSVGDLRERDRLLLGQASEVLRDEFVHGAVLHLIRGYAFRTSPVRPGTWPRSARPSLVDRRASLFCEYTSVMQWTPKMPRAPSPWAYPSGVEVTARIVIDDEFGSVDADDLSDAIEPVEVALEAAGKNGEELAPVETCAVGDLRERDGLLLGQASEVLRDEFVHGAVLHLTREYAFRTA